MVGAGAAGLYAALTAASEGARVVLVSRSPLAETASYWAQGGIAAALADDDSPELHQADTLAAGATAAGPMPPACCAMSRPPGWPTWRPWACASTPTAPAPSHWAWREATHGGGWCTPGAAPPAGA